MIAKSESEDYILFRIKGHFVHIPVSHRKNNVGEKVYTIGSPLFDKSEIQLANGKVFTMIAHGVSWENKYIQSAKLNGAEYNKTWFTHEDVMKGGTLELFMGDRPNKKWGVGEGANPPSGEFVD